MMPPLLPSPNGQAFFQQVRSPQDNGSNLFFGPGGTASMGAAASVTPSPQALVTAQSPFQVPTTPAIIPTLSSHMPIDTTVPTTEVSTSLRQPSQSFVLSTTVSIPATSSASSRPAVSSSSLESSFSSVVVTPTSSSSVITLSTTASSTSPAAASSTLAAPLALTPSTLAHSHSPTFYVGVSFIAILSIAVLCAFIAWLVRLRRQLKRRHTPSNTPPWASGDAVASTTLPDVEKVAGFGRMNRDRDVGEPKREGMTRRRSRKSSDSYATPPPRSATSLRPSVLVNPFGDTNSIGNSGYYPSPPPILFDSLAYPLPPPPPPVLHVDTWVADDENPFASSHSLGRLHITNLSPEDILPHSTAYSSEFGTPRETIPGARPRFLGLDNGGLDVPWASEMTDSLSRKWSRCSSTSDRGQDTAVAEEDDSSAAGTWGRSLKVNFLNACNALTSSLGQTTTGGEKNSDVVNFTELPSRARLRSRSNPSPSHSRRVSDSEKYVEFFGGELVGLAQPLSRVSTVASQWSLEPSRRSDTIRFRDHNNNSNPNDPCSNRLNPYSVPTSRSRSRSVYSTASATPSMDGPGAGSIEQPLLPDRL